MRQMSGLRYYVDHPTWRGNQIDDAINQFGGVKKNWKQGRRQASAFFGVKRLFSTPTPPLTHPHLQREDTLCNTRSHKHTHKRTLPLHLTHPLFLLYAHTHHTYSLVH